MTATIPPAPYTRHPNGSTSYTCYLVPTLPEHHDGINNNINWSPVILGHHRHHTDNNSNNNNNNETLISPYNLDDMIEHFERASSDQQNCNNLVSDNFSSILLYIIH